jgi:phosphatidylglycerol:prolipoprotein diacylglycerol transferase
MQRTLFFIPHSLFGVPIFGFGWALLLLAVCFVVWSVAVARGGQTRWSTELRQNGPVWLIAAVVIAFVIPAIEIRSINGEPLGIAVRGYGIFLLAGVSAGIALASYRAPRLGVDRDHIFALALWMFVGGIGGARLFYIIEYRDQFLTGSLGGTLAKVLDFTRGGLVVYGSIIGGTVAILAYAGRRRISALRLCDVIIPSLFIGLFFGRLGCLMNGCCDAVTTHRTRCGFPRAAPSTSNRSRAAGCSDSR